MIWSSTSASASSSSSRASCASSWQLGRDVARSSNSAPRTRRPRRAPSSDQVDDAANSSSRPSGSCSDDRVRLQAVPDLRDAALGIGADAVHLVDEGDARDLVAVGLAPHRLGLRLDAGDRAEDRDRAVEHAQRPLDLDGEVDVAGRVDEVDAVVASRSRWSRPR